MRQTVVGVFDRYADAQRAAEQLRSSGFADSVFVTEESDAPYSDASSTASAASTAAPADEGVVSRVKHFFSGLFDDDDATQVKPYAEAVRRGGGVVKVQVDEEDEAEQARDALEAAGAVDIDERAAEWRASGWSEGSEYPQGTAAGLSATPAIDAAAATRETESVIPVIEEELQVGKRNVGTGTVRVYSRLVETPVEESISLRSERAEVQRRSVDRPATAADLDALQDRTIEVRETAEQAVVAKSARVVEEVSVGKTIEDRTEIVSDTVRHTEVDVERSGAEARDLAAYDTYAPAYRSDFETRYAGMGSSYDEYEPAYRYGHSLGADSSYAGQGWEHIEPQARRDWETRHPGSAWERFKGAIQHGWHKVTG